MTNVEFANKAISVSNMNTVYVHGAFGVYLGNETQLKRYTTNREYNIQNAEKIKTAAKNDPCFGFDCVGLIKGILWGFNGTTQTYGGAVYCSNDIPDVNADNMFKDYCYDKQDFSTITVESDIAVGSFLYMEGHIGVYVGDGIVVESTTAGEGKVRRAALNAQKWTHYGKSMFLDYEVEPQVIGKLKYVDSKGYIWKYNSMSEMCTDLQSLYNAGNLSFPFMVVNE